MISMIPGNMLRWEHKIGYRDVQTCGGWVVDGQNEG